MMKIFFKYIFIVAAIAAFASCSVDDIDNGGSNGKVKFVVRPTNFMSYNVSENTTKALSNNQLTDLESKVVNAYFFIFDESGNKVYYKEWDKVTGNIPSQELDLNFENFNEGDEVTVCYIANVPSSYNLSSIEKYSELQNITLEFNYASYDVTGYIGIPVFEFNGTSEYCFPMYGEEKCSLTAGEVSIPLKRIFAKVNVEIEWKTQVNTGNLFADQGFNLNFYQLSNLPKWGYLTENSSVDNYETPWVNNMDAFDSTIRIESSDETGVLKKIEFAFYIPEYVLLPDTDVVSEITSSIAEENRQKHKPVLYDTDKFPVFITINGIVKSTDFTDVPVEYSIYLGENNFDSFSFYRNNQYNNTITITGTGDAILGTDHRVEAKYYNLADPGNTGTDDPANCYIIGRPGRYLIPTYCGNDLSTILGGIDDTKTEIHSDGKNSITNIQFIEGTEDGERNWIMFDVNMAITSGAIAGLTNISDGNTVLEFKDKNGDPVWSWHLWFTSGGVAGSEWGAIDFQEYDTQALMMNRNLGSSGAGQRDGTYYQWGDKDPYFTTSGDGGSSAYHGGGDLNGSWGGDSKSVTDPCPPGYKVPASSVWLSEEDWKKTDAGKSNSIHGSQFVYYGNASLAELSLILYPYSEYISEDGNQESNSKGYVKYDKPEWSYTTDGISVTETVPVKIKYKFLGREYSITVRLPGSYKNIYTDLDLEININKKSGRFWATDIFLNYENYTLDINSLSLDDFKNAVKINKYKQYQTKIINYTISNIDYSIRNGLTYDSEPVWSEPELIKESNTDDLNLTDKAALLYALYKEGDAITITNYNKNNITNTNEGYQIRCVKE